MSEHMPRHKDFKFIPTSTIHIEREQRQRKVIETKGLKDSIAQVGILNPIIITKANVLVAGERRLACALELALPSVPVRYLDDMTAEDQQVIELEENLKRADLLWQDECRAMAALHKAYETKNPQWSVSHTARELSLDMLYVQRRLKISAELDNPKYNTLKDISAALSLLERANIRAADNAFSDIMDGVGAAFDDGPLADAQYPHTGTVDAPIPPGASSSPVPRGPHIATTPNPTPPPEPPDSILTTSFLTWAPAYTGPKFNFIHCDFPYGIGVFAGEMGASGAQPYDDGEEIYWELLACFCKNLDNFMSHSAHLMFWFSFKHYEKTLDFFSTHAPSLAVQKFPLVWVKSDNKGILPDYKRGPRQIYETCLIASREDRFIIKAKSNAYVSPTDRLYHVSAKPEPMLAFFMEMFVDNTTLMLDPTCGGGSSLRAAERLGAKKVLGLELDSETAEGARHALRKARILAKS